MEVELGGRKKEELNCSVGEAARLQPQKFKLDVPVPVRHQLEDPNPDLAQYSTTDRSPASGPCTSRYRTIHHSSLAPRCARTCRDLVCPYHDYLHNEPHPPHPTPTPAHRKIERHTYVYTRKTFMMMGGTRRCNNFP